MSAHQTNAAMATGASATEPCDTHDFAALYQAWSGPVHRWIRALGGPAIDADDLTQEVFIVVQRQLERFRGANLGGWLYRIAQLTVRDHRRRAWYRHVFLRSRDVALDEIVSPASAPDERLDRREREVLVYRLVDQLSPRWRYSFLLYELCGLSGDEIATMVGLPPPTVRTHLSRARKEIGGLMARLHARGEL